jgi:hypothetical protein
MKNKYLSKLQNRWRNGSRLMTLIAVTAALSLSASAFAQKKTKPGGGGGETTPVPAGSIHFTQSTADGWNYADMTMKADGSAKTQIGLSEQGRPWQPSYQLHGGQRWFLTLLDTDVIDEEGWMKQDLFALTAAGDRVRLTDDPNLWVDNVRWAKDDSFVSYLGYHLTTEEEDLYVAGVDWSSGSPVVGLPRKVLSTLYPVEEFNLNYLGAYEWSPAGDEMVYNDIRNWDRHEVRVARFLADGSVQTRHLGYGLYPAWSADGNWIAYGGAGIWKIRPDGSGVTQLSTAAFSQQHTDQVWSPDGQHLAFTQSTRTTSTKRGVTSTTYTYDILRISANGGTATNLTTDTAAHCWSIGWR